MIVSTIQNCILLFSVLFGALAMAAPLDPFDVHDTNNLRPREIAGSEVSWASLSATFIDTKGDQPPTTVNNQAAKNAINQFFKIALPKLVRKKKNLPAIRVTTWKGTPQPRWLVHGGETGRYTQTISVKLPAMPAVGYYAPATYVLSVSWSNKKVSGVLRPDKLDKIIVEVKEDQLVYAARKVSYAVTQLENIPE
ncbi:hypothetical protein DFH05DRAFT_1544891 [Lentinula detonsa]|uniref:Uncharacterized protein n=1 Tax=Lentinula detonsa TaxID=2804962 RepID=A0A9W8TVU2_9AGAR|nr:hypothetical protein DFH05DRAFT_1544891 [Lentinula detonsa]KAJ3983928.1 hypothetical protein F5890DRAFT_112258 [Lentinula detonsa]